MQDCLAYCLAFLSGWELTVVLLLALLLFGGRVPKVARSLGKGLSEFKRGVREIEAESGLADAKKAVRTVRDRGRSAVHEVLSDDSKRTE